MAIAQEDGVDAAQIALQDACSRLQTALARKASRQGLTDATQDKSSIGIHDNPAVLYETLLHEFQQDCNDQWRVIEDYASEEYFARSVEWYVANAISWNKHIFACIRSSRGEISRQKTSNGLDNITAVVYECDFGPNVRPYLQDFDCFEQVIHMIITSPLRTLQSMHYVQEYYEALIEEIRSSVSHLTVNRCIRHSDVTLCGIRLEHLETIMKQIESGFEEEIWWESKRALSPAADLRRQQEESRAKKILEEERLQTAKHSEEQQAQERELNEARLENEKLRLKFRNDCTQPSALLDHEDVESTPSPLVPFAIFYEDENFLSTLPKSETLPNVRPWPRITARGEVISGAKATSRAEATPSASIMSSHASKLPDKAALTLKALTSPQASSSVPSSSRLIPVVQPKGPHVPIESSKSRASHLLGGMDCYLFQDRVPMGELVEEGPENPLRLSLIIPFSIWLRGPHEEYLPTEFSDYLSVRGWDKIKLFTGQWSTAHPNNASKSNEACMLSCMSVIQSWLTLGFLEAIFDTRIPIDKYTRPLNREIFDVNMHDNPMSRTLEYAIARGQSRYFHTKHLVSNLVALQFCFTQTILAQNPATPNSPWLRGTPETNIQNPERRRSLIANALAEMGRALNSFRNLNLPFPEDQAHHLFPCILVLPTLLATTALSHIPSALKIVQEVVWYAPKISALQIDQLVSQKNWCPWTVTKLIERTNYSVFYWVWASGFESLSSKSHSNCGANHCKAYQIENLSSYKTQHSAECMGKCATFHPLFEELKNILETGKIPLISAIRSKDEVFGYSVSVVEYDSDFKTREFVAFSHVWADGRGSTTEDGLPHCQLRYLIEAVTSLPQSQESVAFWIDSLCLPKEPSLRTKAIEQMAHIYQSAKSIIILDGTLLKCSIHTSPEEVLLRIYISAWMDRVWTFHEAVLAQQLYFKMKDGYSLLEFSPHPTGFKLSGPLQVPPFRDLMRDIYCKLRQKIKDLL